MTEHPLDNALLAQHAAEIRRRSRNGYPTPARSPRVTDNGRGRRRPYIPQPLRQSVADN